MPEFRDVKLEYRLPRMRFSGAPFKLISAPGFLFGAMAPDAADLHDVLALSDGRFVFLGHQDWPSVVARLRDGTVFPEHIKQGLTLKDGDGGLVVVFLDCDGAWALLPSTPERPDDYRVRHMCVAYPSYHVYEISRFRDEECYPAPAYFLRGPGENVIRWLQRTLADFGLHMRLDDEADRKLWQAFNEAYP